MIVLIIIVILIFPFLRFIIKPKTIYLTLKYAFSDIYDFFRYKKYNNCKYFGEIIFYTALFGRGKTLSLARFLTNAYNRFNGKPVWSVSQKKFVPQRIYILSNFVLEKVPYIPLINPNQITDLQSIDDSDTCVFLVAVDEASTQFNSRNYKDNLSIPVLNSILTCRHIKMGMFLTSQKFKHTDALLRQVTSMVMKCRKLWRFMQIKLYDPDELEYSADITKVKAKSTYYYFIENSHFENYNTYALVDNFKKEKMVSNSQIISDMALPSLQKEEKKKGLFSRK